MIFKKAQPKGKRRGKRGKEIKSDVNRAKHLQESCDLLFIKSAVCCCYQEYLLIRGTARKRRGKTFFVAIMWQKVIQSVLKLHIFFLPCLLQLIWQPCKILHRPSLSPLPKRQHLRGKKEEELLENMDLKKVFSVARREESSQSNLLFQRSFSPSLSPSPSAGTGSLPPGPPSEPLSETSVWTAGVVSRVHKCTHKLCWRIPVKQWSDLPMMALFLSVSASFSTILWVWVVINRRVFSASLYAGHNTSDLLSLRSHLISQWVIPGNIFSRLHEFKVPPDRLGDLWLCDTDSLYPSIDIAERETKNANQPWEMSSFSS